MRAVFEALLALGVPLEGLEPGDLLDDVDDAENLRFCPEEDHVDILASIGKMAFDQVWRNRVETEVDGLLVPFISKAELIENKREVGRLRDLADVEVGAATGTSTRLNLPGRLIRGVLRLHASTLQDSG